MLGAVVALLDRASDLQSEVVGSNLSSGRNCPWLRWDPWARHRTPNRSPGAAASAAHCSKCVCTWMVKWREHISLLIIFCIIVYVTNKAHLSFKKFIKKMLVFSDHCCHSTCMLLPFCWNGHRPFIFSPFWPIWTVFQWAKSYIKILQNVSFYALC